MHWKKTLLMEIRTVDSIFQELQGTKNITASSDIHDS